MRGRQLVNLSMVVLLMLTTNIFGQSRKNTASSGKEGGKAAASREPRDACQKETALIYDSDGAHATGVAGVASAHFEIELASWRDPFTIPHSKTDCCKTEEVDHTGVIICTGYCSQCQWMDVHAVLVVDIDAAADIAGAISDCHNQAAAAGLVTGIVTAALGGGGGALDAAAKAYVAYFSACLQGKISQKIIGVRIDFRSSWGNWVGC